MGETDSGADPRTAQAPAQGVSQDSSTGAPQEATQDVTPGHSHADLLRDAARSQFQTPTWLGERLGAPQIPVQSAPAHDEVAVAPIPQPDGILEEAHWSEHNKPRVVAGTVLTLAILGALGSLVAVIITQSIPAMVALGLCAVVAILFRSALISTGVTTTDLRGAMLTVHREGTKDSFNLMDPQQRLEVIGTPDSPLWRLRLEALGGRIVELTPAQVDPAELMPAVAFYQAVAAREREDRARRFNR